MIFLFSQDRQTYMLLVKAFYQFISFKSNKKKQRSHSTVMSRPDGFYVIIYLHNIEVCVGGTV